MVKCGIAVNDCVKLPTDGLEELICMTIRDRGPGILSNIYIIIYKDIYRCMLSNIMALRVKFQI